MITRRTIVSLLPVLLAAGCASGPAAPGVLTLTINAGANQNPDTAGQPAPVAVRLYQLSATGSFESADVFSLIDHEAATLGQQEAVPSEQFVIAPGQKRVITRTLHAGVQAIGVAVLFRDIDHATWRVHAAAAASGPTKLMLTTAGIVAKLSAG